MEDNDTRVALTLLSSCQAQPAKRTKAEHGPHATEQRPSQRPPGFSPLHCEIKAFAEEALPSKAEMQLVCFRTWATLLPANFYIYVDSESC